LFCRFGFVAISREITTIIANSTKYSTTSLLKIFKNRKIFIAFSTQQLNESYSLETFFFLIQFELLASQRPQGGFYTALILFLVYMRLDIQEMESFIASVTELRSLV